MNVYRKAIEVIKERGRTQGSLIERTSGKVCLVGALALAKGMSVTGIITNRLPKTGDYCCAYDYIQDIAGPVASIIRDNYGYGVVNDDVSILHVFNDENTDNDVILVLEKAAIQWDELNGE